MERKNWLYIALILLVIGVVSAVVANSLKFGPYDPTLNAILMILAVIGILGAALTFFWWAILKRSESIRNY